MMDYAEITNGVVTNTPIAASAAFALQMGWVPAVDGAGNVSAFGDIWSGTRFSKPGLSPLDRAAAATAIDDAVAAVYGRFTRFQVEYEERETQARAYVAAGYPTSPVPQRVSEFAIPAGLTSQAAADLIIVQADGLRAAQGQLSTLRMQKYEVIKAANDADARAALSSILASVAAINGALT